MVQFSSGPMDHHYYTTPVQEDPKIEEPIIPINELGETVPESDPRTGAHILQNIEAAIRRGTSKLQLIWMTPHNQPMGGRPKAYGRDVRQAIREMLETNKVEMTGTEMPTGSMTNLSGFDPQRFTISEEKRQRDIQEVKDAIDFAVDVAGGGGIEVWSQEMVRDITDAKWNANKKNRFYDYSQQELKFKDDVEAGKPVKYDERIETVKFLADKRTGQVLRDSIRKSQKITVPKYMTASDIDGKYKTNFVGAYSKEREQALGDGTIQPGDYVDLTGKWLDVKNNTEDQLLRVPFWDEKNSRFEPETLTWDEVVKRTKTFNNGKPDEKRLTPAEYAFRLQLENQILQARGQSLFYTREYEQLRDGIIEMQEAKKRFLDDAEHAKKMYNEQEFKVWQEHQAQRIAELQGRKLPVKPEEIPESFDRSIARLQHELKHIHEASGGADARAEELEQMKENVTTPDKIAVERTTDSYAELGIYAMERTKSEKAKKPITVGPELGWPTMYGGHPKEFITIIEKAREKMAKQLHERGMTMEDAKERAKRHIKGSFDTSHLAMWYNHFERKPNESEEQRLKRFNKWYLQQVEEMQKKDVIGTVQVVDSITGQHSHLPVGQGIFPIVEASKLLKKKGYKGSFITEGHEEERFGTGRMTFENWKAFGSPVGSGYFSGMAGPHTWTGIQHAYFGATPPPTYIVGAYVPSNEWTLWSEVPFE